MYEYRLPFSDSIETRIGQAIGPLAHENFTQIRYAIDYVLEEGASILAARGGKIIKVKSDSNTHFKPEDLRGKTIDQIVELANRYTNFVAIQHDDGTYAEYVHLGENSIVVRERQEVKQGDLLGYTGWSGIMDQPHLHFNVFIVKDGKAISIPTNLNKND